MATIHSRAKRERTGLGDVWNGAARYKLLPLVTFLIASCSPVIWNKQGVTPSQFGQDDARCRLVARGLNSGEFYAQGSQQFVAGAAIGNAIGTAINTEATYRDCMMAAGYTEQKATPVPSPQQTAPIVSSAPMPVKPSDEIVSAAPAPSKPSDAAIAWENKATDAGSKADWIEVVRTSSIAIDQAKDFTDAYISRSQAYIALGFREKASTDVSAALALEPGNLKAMNNRAVLERDSQNQGDAERDFTTACNGGLQLACDNYKAMDGYFPSEKPQVLINQSVELYNNGDWDGVVRATSDALALNPKLEWAYVNRAGALANQGKVNDALADVAKAIALNPDNGMAYFNKAFAFSQSGDRYDAMLNYAIACRLHVDRGCALAGKVGMSPSK